MRAGRLFSYAVRCLDGFAERVAAVVFADSHDCAALTFADLFPFARLYLPVVTGGSGFFGVAAAAGAGVLYPAFFGAAWLGDVL